MAEGAPTGDPHGMSDDTERKKTRRDDDEVPHFACVFCHAESPKPFEICKICGTHQPPAEVEEE